MTDTDKPPIVGPIGDHVRRNVEELRGVRKIGTPALSALLRDLGHPILPSVLHRLGQGQRRTDVDDLVALAVVLGVNPSALLFDRHAGRQDMIELVPGHPQRADVVWAWADGQEPLPAVEAPPDAPVTRTLADMVDFTTNARPDLDRYRGHPAVLAAREVITALRVTLMARDEAGGWPDDEARQKRERQVGNAIDRLTVEVRDLFDGNN